MVRQVISIGVKLVYAGEWTAGRERSIGANHPDMSRPICDEGTRNTPGRRFKWTLILNELNCARLSRTIVRGSTSKLRGSTLPRQRRILTDGIRESRVRG